ncbi:uncharacterized protein LOC112523352 isoform X2 [Cynara cardunculus var. scolymus]|uniref:uncharacterized protein LOC112523352 isoform X2 n=1 Tax=Cynara cardunculus var. scolymus TaxID=59895 RepID=UPI000D6235F8|nr:uncharacterized protein LOC112523352 isoform X2 [Cynara cardunculus var. scolymus]
MENDVHRSVSLRASRRPDRFYNNFEMKGADGFFDDKSSSDYPIKVIWKRGFVRLLLVGGILWMMLILAVLLFHIWSCQSSLVFLSAICNKDSTVFHMLHNMGMVTPPHRCSIPLANDPEKIVIPEKRSPSKFVQSLSYFEEDDANTNGSESSPLFGGHQSWKQREESFKLKSSMMICLPKILIMLRGVSLWLHLEYLMDMMHLISLQIEDGDKGQWVGIWRLILLKNPPYDEPRRNGKVPKILTHRLFPQALYSIWIDGKMELIVDPLLMLERYLWRGRHTFAIAQHKHHKSIYEEADSNKRRKRYARPLIDHHIKIYRYEGLDPWSPLKKTKSDVPEGAIIIREHTALNNLFSCLWFNEVNLFTPRDQLSFGFVVYRLKGNFNFFMFPNCEYNSIFILHPHTREHSSKIEWVKSLNELKGNNSGLKESRGGLGLWSPYPADLDLVVLPPVARTSKAG